MAQKISIKFERYRKNVLDLCAPTGQLLAYGYIREFEANDSLDWVIPDDITLLCSQFLDLYLGFDPGAVTVTEDNANNVTLKLMESSKWHEMSELDKRLLRDQLIFDSKKDITMIECEVSSKEFGQSGVQWLAPIIKNVKDLCYINLSNSYLNDASVQIICESIHQNGHNKPLKVIRIPTQVV